jgi:glycosyltransferase involved in cell wall biosynthesis
VSCQHVPDDKRVTHKEGLSFRDAGFRVTWVGPRRPRTGNDYGIDFRFYPAGKGRLSRLLHHRKAERLAGEVPDVDVYFAVEPDSAAVVVKLARRREARAVFDIHEVYHREMLGRWVKGRLLRRLVGWLVRRRIEKTCRQCDLVIGVSDAVLRPYLSPNAERLVVRNCAAASFAQGEPASEATLSAESFTVMHGLTHEARGTHTVTLAARIAAEKVRSLKVIMFDSFALRGEPEQRRRFEEFIRQNGAEGIVEVRQPVPHSEMPAITRSCHAGLIAYDRQWGVRCLPNRVFEYMAAGIPLIAPEYAEEIRRIVERERCGLLVDCEDPSAIAEAIVRLAENPDEAAAMGRRAREGFIQRHNWQKEVQPLIDRIRTWVGDGAGR